MVTSARAMAVLESTESILVVGVMLVASITTGLCSTSTILDTLERWVVSLPPHFEEHMSGLA